MPNYTPVLKAKRNDLGAINALSAKAKACIFPLIEAPITINGGSLETRAVEAALAASKNLGALPFYFDPLGIESPQRQVLAFETLIDAESNFVPTVGIARTPIPLPQLSSVVDKTGHRVAFRLESADIEDPEATWDKIAAIAAQLKVPGSNTTILLDLAQLRGRDLDLLQEMTLDYLAYEPKALHDSNIVLIGGSALNSVAEVPIDGMMPIARRELALWGRLSFELGQSRNLAFGDYGIIDPSFVFAGGPSGNANAKIRYTRGARTIYFRGHGLYKPNRFDQYHDLAQKVMDTDLYLGEHYSYGDRRIANCASHQCGSGNLATWVQVDMNHHLEYTSSQISRLVHDISGATNEEHVNEAILIE